MVKFFWMPMEIWYYVIIPIIAILVIYFLFWLFYRKKRGTYYYNYVVDYVYSTLGIVFCSLLFCLLLGYSIATIQILSEAGLLKNYLFLAIILIILPVVPSCFLVYVIKVYIKNLKRKEKLDLEYENIDSKPVTEDQTDFTFGRQDKNEIPSDDILLKEESKQFEESEFDLVKKK